MLCGGKLSEGIIIGSLLSMLSAVVVSLPQYPDIGQVNSLHGQVTIGTLRQQEVGNLGNVGGKDLSRTLYLITRTTLFIRGRRVGNKWEKDGALWSGPSIPSHGSNEREEPHGAKSAIYLRCRLSSCSCRRRLMHSSHQFETLTRISSPSSPVCRRRRRDRGDGSRGGRRGRRLPSLKNVSVVVSRSQSTSFSLYAAAKNPRSFCLKRLDHDTYRTQQDLQGFLERRIPFHRYNYPAAPPS
ncbi:hypothetical protein MUK42_21412 [Musa troglodytarum]|nr:hypothetical protein MUK42_21412 [Musa troglodytarum]